MLPPSRTLKYKTYLGVFLCQEKVRLILQLQYFDVILSKTENGIRKVPIADKVLPFYKAWYDSSDCEYLLHTDAGKQFQYRNYKDSYWTPLIENYAWIITHMIQDTPVYQCLQKHT